MKTFIDTNNNTKALVIRKESSLVIVHNAILQTVKISKKVIFATITLTLLNMVI